MVNLDNYSYLLIHTRIPAHDKRDPGDEVERPWERVCPCDFSETLVWKYCSVVYLFIYLLIYLFIYLFIYLIFTKKDIR